jgi:pimeloyl-ACP methyl ester carboxylesterase
MKTAAGQGAYVAFQGEKSSWHDGFERYDYLMDSETLAISPFKRTEGEGFGVAPPMPGQRRCVVVCPKNPAPGNPWSWRGCYWDHQPQTEIELLRRGFHIAYVSADASLKPDQCWDAWYSYLTKAHGLSAKPVFIGMSRGGQFALDWATSHPDKVSGIYADNPGGDDAIFRGLIDLAHNDVPLLFVCGTIDSLLPRFAEPWEEMYRQFGGRVSVLLKDGAGHHPHSLNDPTELADFLVNSASESLPIIPDFVRANQFTRSSYYSRESTYAWDPKNGYFISRRGPAFVPCYKRYALSLGFETAVNIVVPLKEAPGRPWVLRPSFVPSDAAVDQALLARGYHIVVGPVGYNSDGLNLADWNKMYAYLTDHGFEKKPVIEGEGGGAGAVCAWAVENPDKVSCIFALDPIWHAAGVDRQPIDRLDVLTKAGVPLMQFLTTPDTRSDQKQVEARYQASGGVVKVIRTERMSPSAVDSAVAFIVGQG